MCHNPSLLSYIKMGDNMNNETLKQLIYNELLSAELYGQLCATAKKEGIQICFETFEKDCDKAAKYLTSLYQYNNTSSFHPIIKKVDISDKNLKDSIQLMFKRECEMYRELLNLSYLTTLKVNEREVVNYVNGICMGHATVLSYISI